MAGIDAFFLSSSENLAEWHLLSFIPQSGRALVFPIYKDTYERQYQKEPGDIARREYTVWATQDLNRTVNYIAERPDLDEDWNDVIRETLDWFDTYLGVVEPTAAAASNERR